MASLDGKVVAFLEARMTSEMASLVERHGGVPYPAPVLQEVYLKDSPEVRQLVDDVCAGRLDAMVLLTGVGTQALVGAASAQGREEEFLQALDQLTVIARSPKPARVLRKYRIHMDVMPPEPFTSEDLVAALEGVDLEGKRVGVQRYGGPNSYLAHSLTDRGAEVREVTLYTWGLPDDVAPVVSLMDDLGRGKIDAVAFTSQPQVGNLLDIARQDGREAELRAGLDGLAVVGSIGPVCTRRLLEAGLKVDVEPEHPHMGNLVLALAEHFQSSPQASARA